MDTKSASKAKYWDMLRSVPQDMTKKITGGRLNGMTDIKPQWRIKRFGEVFGDCGTGWYFDIKKQWIEDAGNDEKAAFVEIDLYYKDGETWSKPVSGTGGSMFVAKETKGLHVSDECFKMALTDALSVAMKEVGVAADIYMGQPPDTKYSGCDNPREEEDKKDKLTPKEAKIAAVMSKQKCTRELATELLDAYYMKTVKKKFDDITDAEV